MPEAQNSAEFARSPRPLVRSIAERAEKVESEAREVLENAYQSGRRSSEAAMANFRDRTRRLKEDNPALLLAVIVGSAFVLGIVFGIWRSRRS